MKKTRRLNFCLYLFLMLNLSLFYFWPSLGKTEATAEPNIPIQGEYVPGELIIKFKDGALVQNLSSIESLNQKYQVGEVKPLIKFLREESRLANTYKLKFPENQNISEVISDYSKNPNIEYAEPNYIAKAAFTPNDTYYGLQWHFDNINLPEAWEYDITTPLYGGDSSVIVAVLDTGVAYENYGAYVQASDLANTNFTAGYDFINDDAHPNDDHSHGTHVTGTIAQSTNNGEGAAGIAFNTTIMPVKVLDTDGFGSYEAIANGINFAVANGAQVISMSLGGSSSSTLLEDAVTEATNAGVVVIAAAGNGGDDAIGDPILDYPGAYVGVIGVGATRYDNALSPYSNYGPDVDLVAPGGDTSVDQNADGYADGVLQQTCDDSSCSTFWYYFFQGTSMATPHVAGATALLLAYGVPAENIQSVLESTATDLGDAGYDTTFGWGLLNVQQALASYAGDTVPPTGSITIAAGHRYTKDRTVNLTLSASDTGSGVTQMRFSNDGSTFSDWETYSTRKSNWNLTNTNYGGTTADGTKRVYVAFRDAVGNQVTVSDTIKYDTTPPSAPDISGWSNSDRVLALTSSHYYQYTRPHFRFTRASDNVSGIDGYYVYFGTNRTANPVTSAHGRYRTQANYTANITSSTSQTYYLIVKAKDNAGNISSATTFIYKYRQGLIVTAPGVGGGPQIKIFKRNGTTVGTAFFAYDSTFRGGVNVAVGDVDGDGLEDIITGPGPGGGSQVRVFDAQGRAKSSFFAYDSAFRGGVTVATGDLNGDGTDEIITGTVAGAPQVRIFNYRGNTRFTTGFFAYDSAFRGGVRVAAGDLDDDSKDEIITAPGLGGGPQIKIFDRLGRAKLTTGFMAYDSAFRGGVNVAAGDLNSDGKDEIITGTVTGAPQVRIFNYRGNTRFTTGFFAYDSAFRGGINVAAGDLNGDGTEEIITGTSVGTAQVRIFDKVGGTKFTTGFFAYDTAFRGGVSVAAGVVR